VSIASEKRFTPAKAAELSADSMLKFVQEALAKQRVEGMVID